MTGGLQQPGAAVLSGTPDKVKIKQVTTCTNE